MIKENSIQKGVCVYDTKDILVKMPLQLIAYLSNDYTFKNPKRFTKLKAFENLINRYCQSYVCNENKAVNITQLSKDWGWSRLTVFQFVSELHSMNLVEVNSVSTSKFVSMRSEVFGWVSSSVKGANEAGTASLASEEASFQSPPSMEKKEDFSSDKKFSEN